MVQSRKRKSATKKKTTSDSKTEQPSNAITKQHTTVDGPEDEDTFKRVIGEVADYAIFLLDPDGNILSWNKGAEKIKGYSSSEIIGRNHRLFYTKEDKEKDLSSKLLAEAKRKGTTNYEGWRVRKDGTRFWGRVTITALHHKNGSIRGYLKITRDLNDVKVAEDNYSNFVEDLKLKNEELQKTGERYHKMISEVLDYSIILLDKNGKVLDWNKGAEKVKGYAAKEIIGKSFRLFYPKEEKDSKLPERLLAEAVRHGSIRHEGWRIRKDGKRFWGNITITALYGKEGDLIGFSKVTFDLTNKKIAEDKVSNVMEELRQTNEQLKQSEERYHKMIEEVQDYAIILLNRDGDIQNWNAGAEFIKGYKAKEVVGQNFRIFYTPEDLQNKLPETLLAQARQTGKAIHEGWRVRKDGSTFWGSIVITALHSAEGEILGFSKVTRDLTERKNAEDSLKANAAQLDLKNKTLERLNEELSSFTHIASHDMKEPLRKIQTFAARIEQMGFSPEKAREYLDKIKSCASQMQNLMDDLLSYSEVTNDTSNREKTDLNKALQAAKSDLEIAIAEKNATIDSDRLPVVVGVPHQLHQIFLNLLSNAIKFSKAEEVPRIIIKAEIIRGPDIPGYPTEGKNKYHHISIADNGIGFEHQNNDRIFEAFQRLHSKRTFSGTGIGLAIVKKIIENHNGTISAKSELNKGATFNIYIPAA